MITSHYSFRISSRPFIYLFICTFLCRSNSLLATRKYPNPIHQLNGDPEKDTHTFHGIASVYNNVAYYRIEQEGRRPTRVKAFEPLDNSRFYAAVGRFEVLLFPGGNALSALKATSLKHKKTSSSVGPISSIYSKTEIKNFKYNVRSLRYAHLWYPLSELSEVVEALFIGIQRLFFSSWGFTLVAFTVFLKVMLFPVDLITASLQKSIQKTQHLLSDRILDIKSNYKGEEAHNLILKTYKDLNISPFYSLKGMIGPFLKIPFLIAVFNVLGNLPQLSGQPFLWIRDLAYPDYLWISPVSIPMFGDRLSLLPLFLLIVTLASTTANTYRHRPVELLNGQNRKIYLMAGFFFVIFYPFPSSLVLFWTLTSILQIAQNKVGRIWIKNYYNK